MSVKTDIFVSGDTGLAAPTIFLHDGQAFTGKKTIIHLHAAAQDYWSGIRQNAAEPMYALAAAGYLIVAPLTLENWGNSAGMTRITQAADYAKVTLGASTKCAMYGRSMGGLNAVVWASTHLSRVCGIASDSGALDLPRERGTDAGHGLFYTTINADWSPNSANDAAFNTNVKPVADPTTLAGGSGTLNVPHLIGGWASDSFVGDDSVTNAAYITALATGSPGATVTHPTARVGSGHTGSFDLDLSPVTTFFQGLTFT